MKQPSPSEIWLPIRGCRMPIGVSLTRRRKFPTFCLKGQAKAVRRISYFIRKYVQSVDRTQSSEIYSFLLGYFIHLVSDHLWADKIGKASKGAYASLFSSGSELNAWDTIKEDWYGLDQRYVRDHPNCMFWRVFLQAPIPSSPLPFVRQEAFEHQVAYIRDFYSHPSDEWVLDRPYPYLNETSMSRYVDGTCNSILKILRLFSAGPAPEGIASATLLLTSAETAPFTPPLGDI